MATTELDRIIQLYGDMLYDLCESVLWSSSGGQIAFRAVAKSIRAHRLPEGTVQGERAWILRAACKEILACAEQWGRRLTPAEQIMLDASLAPENRLSQFDAYFHRLSAQDQILLLLRDKYGLPYGEIAAILGAPEGSIKVRRQHSLRTLEDWLWNT